MYQLRLYKNIGMWVSIKTLKDEYGVVFDEDKLGMPKVRLITNDRIKSNPNLPCIVAIIPIVKK